ncbi:hypothetical protein [uncultured Ilyobacter sp.]|uniref:hypothetical protein n=1 Tax=uncultured Ilyobacter sp. TaxID=544433 RepID=UPI002AA5F28A|nr:hypothetical protein [uncultured Ilyobacter sp.]
MKKVGYKEDPSELIDINDSETNVTSQGITINQRLEEDIVKGVATELEHEMWLRVRKMGWSRQEVADFFNCNIETVKTNLRRVNDKVKKFKTCVKMRGGNFFY